jgi:hypothetical protein
MTDQISPANSTLPSERRSWAYETRRFRLLGYDFALRCTDEALGRYVDEAFDSSVASGEPSMWYSVVDRLPGKHSHAIFANDVRLMSTSWPEIIVGYVTWHVNRSAIALGQLSHVLVHAAAVSRDHLGLLLPAAMERGKSTLAAGLVRAGFDYLTDEAGAIEVRTGRLAPFPKPLTLDSGSWSLFPELKPGLRGHAREYATKQWQVSPTVIRPRPVSDVVPIRFVVFPEYVRGADTAMRRIQRPSTALVGLLQETFDFHDEPGRNLRVLANVVEAADHYLLTVGNLTDACEQVDELYVNV